MSYLLNAEFIHETERAFCVKYKDEKYWLPKGHTKEVSREISFESGKIEIILRLEDWLAYRKGFTTNRPYNYSYYDDYEDDYENGWDALDPNQ